MLNCLEPDTTQVIEYCWCEHTILTRNINVPLLSSKCYSITHLSINIFLFCPNITNVVISHTVLIDSITKLNQNIVYCNVYCHRYLLHNHRRPKNVAINFVHCKRRRQRIVYICSIHVYYIYV